MYNVTASQIKALAPGVGVNDLDPLVAAINETTARYQINTSARRVRYFVAQTLFETQFYTHWVENLYYSTAARLVAVWPSRFTLTADESGKAYAPDYVGNPQKLASLVYANRGGNGDQASGDGWSFRGRGGLGLTFKSNYTAYSTARYGDDRIVTSPDLVAAPQDAMDSAGWFWSTNNLNALADSDSFTQATKVINGSTDTVPQRLQVLNSANRVLTWAS